MATAVADREARLLALRREGEACRLTGEHQDVLVVFERPEEQEEGLTFYAVTKGGVHEVEIFLDERLISELCEYEVATWQGLIAYIEDDIRNSGL